MFTSLSQLDTAAALALGASKGPFDKTPFLRFDAGAHGEFLDWRGDLEARLRGGELPAALEGHLAKHRKLVPALALIAHLADRGTGPVSRQALLRALAFADYLETHARRLYAAGSEGEVAAAKAILGRIRKDDLKDGFSARDVHQRDWSNLTDRSQVQAGLAVLADLDWIVPEHDRARPGRPTVHFRINPRGRS